MNRFPPIKGKYEETPGTKEKDFLPNLTKKVSEDTNQPFKKQNPGMKKRVDKKKGKGVAIKYEVL